jgi:hypothetical protein
VQGREDGKEPLLTSAAGVSSDSVRGHVRTGPLTIDHRPLTIREGPRHSVSFWACFETSPEDWLVLIPGMFRRDELRRAAHVGWVTEVYHAYGQYGRRGGFAPNGQRAEARGQRPAGRSQQESHA